MQRDRLQGDGRPPTTTTISATRVRDRPSRPAPSTPPTRAAAPRPRASRIGARRKLPLADVGAFALLAALILGFTRAWADGALAFDGPGASLWVQLALDHFRHGGVPYWVPDIWAGTPAWALAPSLAVLPLVPLAALVGAEEAVKLTMIGSQIVGAWGAYVLARSLWDRRLPALVAGLLYGLHPILISHSALAGHQPSLEVMALTPWLVWSLRHALRGDGAEYVGAAGLLAGVGAVLHPEHAYGLALISVCILAVELARARANGQGTKSARALLVRGGAVVAIGLGVIAHWLLPFASLSKTFVLTPPEAVRDTLVQGVGGAIGRNPGILLTRTGGLSGIVAFDTLDFMAVGTFYLSAVCLALTLVTIALLPRRDREGTLTAVLFASAIAIWLQTGGIPLASSGLARSKTLLPLAVIGAVGGLLVGSVLRRIRRGPWAVAVGVATAAFLVVLPYLTPFLTLQQLVPLLRSVRFPRLYPIAVLGLALGATYPLVLAQDWAARRDRRLAPLFTLAMCVLVAGVFALDIHPYRTYYGVHPPPSDAAYRKATARLEAFGGDYRLAGSLDPRAVAPFVRAGVPLSIGWPHPLAGRDLWRVTAEAMFDSPDG